MATQELFVDAELLKRFARLTTEVFECRYIQALLAGRCLTDERPGRNSDRAFAEVLLRNRGWDFREVCDRVQAIEQGLVKVPRPPREAALDGAQPSRGRKLAGALGLGGGGGKLAGWEREVRDWNFLLRRDPEPPVATDRQRSFWINEALTRLREPWRAAAPAKVVGPPELAPVVAPLGLPESDGDPEWL